MFYLGPCRVGGHPLSFAETFEYRTLPAAVSEAIRMNSIREDYPEHDDGIRYDVYMDKPAGDSALLWSHMVGHTYVG